MATPEIVLHAAEHDESGNAEKVAGLVAIGERSKAAFVMPKGQRRPAIMQVKTERGQRDDPGRIKSGGEPDVAQAGIESRDVINPAEPGAEQDHAFNREPGLDRDGGSELDSEVFR